MGEEEFRDHFEGMDENERDELFVDTVKITHRLLVDPNDITSHPQMGEKVMT